MTLPREFYRRPVLRVARDLLGMRVVRLLEGGARLEGTIVEVEAYDGPNDRASHAYRGLTPRTEPMFGEPGRAYVYLIYGIHCCLNVVTGPEGHPAAVLIRALAPCMGVEWMTARKTLGHGSRSTRPAPKARRREPESPAESSRIASGPGLLTRAFHVGLPLNRADLCSEGPLFIEGGVPVPARRVVRGERIGVEYAAEWARLPWRLGIRGHPALSRPFPEDRGTVSLPARPRARKLSSEGT